MGIELSPEEITDLEFITDDKVLPISEIVKEENRENIDRYLTGFSAFDNASGGGFKDGDLIIISGISGEGKTTFAQTLTCNLVKNISCLWFSYEIPLYFLHQKFLSMGLQDNYLAFAPKKNTTGKLVWIKAKIKEAWAKYAVKIVFIDMIDDLSPMDVRDKDNETLTLKRIARELKELALELEIVIITMAHITKLKEGEEAGMQSIAWSSSIYQKADLVFMVTREKIKKEKEFGKPMITDGENLCTDNSFIKIVKNREMGKMVKVKCQFSNNKLVQLTNNYEGINPDFK